MTASPARPPAAAEPGVGHPRLSAAALLHEAAGTLAAAGVPAPDWDAERLLRHVLAWDRATLVTRPQAEVPIDTVDRFRALVRQRSARVPLQHLTGSQAFWKHDFLVTSDVLIPRPETELLVEVSLARLRDRPCPLIVDVGTGSGCIALSLASECPQAELHATDASAAALEIAHANARRLGMERRVTFHLGDLLAPVASLAPRFDLVVSNPPYVDPADRDSLAPEVAAYEPVAALFAAEPFPGIYERLARGAALVLRPGGALVVEIGLGQAIAVSDALSRGGLAVVETHGDLAGIPRAVVALLARW
jgi:release factor glutamine methyltransferase